MSKAAVRPTARGSRTGQSAKRSASESDTHEGQPRLAVSPGVLVQHTTGLLASLRQAFETASEADAKQDQYVLALRLLADFLEEIGGAELPRKRFVQLSFAIRDLKQGTVHPVLKPRGFGQGRAPDPSENWTARAVVALGVEVLIATGLERKQAAKEIVRRFPAVATLARSRSATKTCDVVLSWYEDFRRNRIKSAPGQIVYRAYRLVLRDHAASGRERGTMERLLQEALETG